MNLYELSVDILALKEINNIDETEKAQIMEIIEKQIENKSESIIAVVRGLELDINSVDEEIKRLTLLKKNKQNNLNNLKKYTKECMERIGSKRIQTKLGDISIRKNPASVNIIDEKSIPKEYIQLKTTELIDKKALLKDLKNGVVIEGVEIAQGTSISIR